MDRRTALESETPQLDLSLSKHMTSGRTKTRKNNTPAHYEPVVHSSVDSLSLDPTTHALMPSRSSISSLLSLSHLRLWENPMTASAISAAAAMSHMSHLMDINHTTNSSPFGKSNDESNNVNNSPNMCLICGRVTRDRNELENHMLSHSMDSMDKPLEYLKYGLKPNRIHGLLMSSKKRKSKHFSQNCEQPLDVSVTKGRKKRVDDCHSPKHEDKNNISYQTKEAINSINTNAFPCSSCHKTFATEVDLKAHLMRHLTQHPFVCLACGKGFKYEHSLNFHIKSYHNNSNNNNNTNNNTTNTANNDNNCLNNNNNNNNIKNNMENESKEINSNIKIDSEKRNEEKEKMISEEVCEQNCEDETSIDGEHSDEAIDDDNEDENQTKSESVDMGAPPLNIGARSIQIKSEKLLITMLEGIHPVTEQSYVLYKCCLCGFAFPSLEPVVLHLQASHLNANKEFTCDKCGANFKWRSELTLHEQLHKAMDHNDKSGGHLSIPSFIHPSLVLMGADFAHNLSPNHSFENNNNNNNLFINNNNNSLSEGMSVCDDKHNQNNYRSHKKSILQNKSIKSKPESHHSSDMKVKVIKDMQNVVQLSHKFPQGIGDIEETSPGQFKCRFCDKTFDRIFSVHRHERVHTGFKPCICKTCGRGFSEKRNLRHHIIRFHSDGSGRELLKRNRKDKNNSSNSNKRKMATSLKKAALKILNANESLDMDSNDNHVKVEVKEENQDEEEDEEEVAHEREDNVYEEKKSEENAEEHKEISSNSKETSINCSDGTNAIQNTSSSKRRRKGMPSKKIITTEPDFSLESSSDSMEDNEALREEEDAHNFDGEEYESMANSGSDINPNDFLETKLRCHGAFFSSYNPRLGVVEKPVKRNEACRPLVGPDGKFLYPCSYCNKTFCSLSDLNRHMNFHEDVRPFKCEFCEYQSRTNSQLKVHMMRHAGIKQYLCQICAYNGVTQSDLNRHCKTRSHALRSANICPLCSLGFSTQTLLDDHILKFHEMSESSDCSDKTNKTSNMALKTSTPQPNNNELSFSSKSFSVKEILN